MILKIEMIFATSKTDPLHPSFIMSVCSIKKDIPWQTLESGFGVEEEKTP